MAQSKDKAVTENKRERKRRKIEKERENSKQLCRLLIKIPKKAAEI